MTPRGRNLLKLTPILVAVTYLIGSELYYARSISPKGISTARDYIERFGEPRDIRIVHRNGQSYYEFTGQLPSRWVLATPSSPPAYIFDREGRFVSWCKDPGDTPSYHHTWSAGTNSVHITVIRQMWEL